MKSSYMKSVKCNKRPGRTTTHNQIKRFRALNAVFKHKTVNKFKSIVTNGKVKITLDQNIYQFIDKQSVYEWSIFSNIYKKKV